MISIRNFKKIFNDIQEHEEKNDVLTKIIVSKDSSGWVDYGTDLVDDIILVLNELLEIDKEDDLLFWWLYDAPQNEKFCYEDIKGDDLHCIMYNLNDLEDLYYYATKQFDTVKQKIVEKDSNEQVYKPVNINFEDIINGKINS